MAKPKPVGYDAAQKIDAATMYNSEALRDLVPIIRENLTAEDRVTRVARAIHNIHESIETLKEIKQSPR